MSEPLLDLLAAVASEARDLGCAEADLRAVDRELEWLIVRNGNLEARSRVTDSGVGVRVWIDGARGYAATRERDGSALRRALRAACEMARSAGRASKGARSPRPPEPQVGTWSTPMPGGDPFQVPLEERVERLMDLDRVLRTDSRVVAARATQAVLRRRTRLASMHGTRIDQTITLNGGGMRAVAQDAGQLQQRSWPKDFEGNVLQGGEELWAALALPDHAERVREEAIALCHADPCPERRTNVILDGAQLSLQIHESCGHPIEADRVLREELSLAGSSFLTPDRLAERFQYGSERVQLVADSTTETGPGTFRWDDEGNPAGCTDIVRDGVFSGYLTDRASAPRVGGPFIGACRAESWQGEPIVRMVNVNLEPGDAGSLDDLIAATDEGVLISTNRSWSIDDHRLNFQFGAEAAWEIRGGRRGRLLRNPVYTGITPQFWQGCDAICGEEDWSMWGWMFCGKGDPLQLMHVGHGCAPARFRDVQVRAS